MEINRKMLYAMLLTLMVFLVLEGVDGKENKNGEIYALCGTDFLLAYNKCCGHKYPACISSNEDVANMKRRVLPVLPSRVAKNFFGKLSKRQVAYSSENASPSEECCNEKCSYEEVAEYECY